MMLALQPAIAVACSCARPQTLTERQLRYIAKDMTLVAHGRVTAVRYPAACRIAPLRWAYALTGSRHKVVYSVAIRRTLWGRPVATTEVVQYQIAETDGCKPLGSAACEAALPRGDTLWVLRRTPDGEQRYAGRCGLLLAPYLIRLAQRTARPVSSQAFATAMRTHPRRLGYGSAHPCLPEGMAAADARQYARRLTTLPAGA